MRCWTTEDLHGRLRVREWETVVPAAVNFVNRNRQAINYCMKRNNAPLIHSEVWNLFSYILHYQRLRSWIFGRHRPCSADRIPYIMAACCSIFSLFSQGNFWRHTSPAHCSCRWKLALQYHGYPIHSVSHISESILSNDVRVCQCHRLSNFFLSSNRDRPDEHGLISLISRSQRRQQGVRLRGASWD
jgi:hypothetical protein